MIEDKNYRVQKGEYRYGYCEQIEETMISMLEYYLKSGDDESWIVTMKLIEHYFLTKNINDQIILEHSLDYEEEQKSPTRCILITTL